MFTFASLFVAVVVGRIFYVDGVMFFQVYDLTDYLDQHPGGDAILRNVGGDATKGFHGPQHPSSVHTTVKAFLIGTVAED